MQVTSVQLAANGEATAAGDAPEQEQKLTACLALWGLAQMVATDSSAAGHNGLAASPVSWKAEIGAPAEGTRKKALPRDEWMPQPQLAEKREAKRARGWVFPGDPIGRYLIIIESFDQITTNIGRIEGY